MTHLDILKALEKRRRKRVEINKSIVSNIQYQADMRRAVERDTMKAEHTRIKGILNRASAWHPQVMRDRYDQLTQALESSSQPAI